MFPTKNKSSVKQVKPRGELTELITPNSSDYYNFISSSTAMSEVALVGDSKWSSSGYHQQIKFSNENEEDQENYPETENFHVGNVVRCQKKSFNEEISMPPLPKERFFQGRLEQVSSLFNKPTASDVANERAGMNDATLDFESFFRTSLKLNEGADDEYDEDCGSSTINSEVSSIDELSGNGLDTFLNLFHEVTETNIALSLESCSDSESEGLESKSTSQLSTVLSQRSADLEADVESEKSGISYNGMMISNTDPNGDEVYYDCVPDLEDDNNMGNILVLVENVDGKEVVSQVHEVAESKLVGIALENLQKKIQPVEANNGITLTFEASEAHMTEAHSSEENDKNTLGSILSVEDERRGESNQGPEMDTIFTDLCPPDMPSDFKQENGTMAPPNINDDQPNIQQKDSIYQRSLFMDALQEASQIVIENTDIISENGTFVIECYNNPSNYFKLKDSWQSKEEDNQCNIHDKSSSTLDKSATLNLEGEQADYMIIQRSQSKGYPSNLMKVLNQATEKLSNTNSKREVDDSTIASSEDVTLAPSGEFDSDGSFICPETEEELDSFLTHVNPFLTRAPLETVQEQMSCTEVTLRMQHSEDLLSLKYLDSEVISTETNVEELSIQESRLHHSQEERSEGSMGSVIEEMPLDPHLIDVPKQQCEGLSLHIMDPSSMTKNQQNDSPKKTILRPVEIEEELYDMNQKTSEHIRSPDDNISGKACEDKLLHNKECTNFSEALIDSLIVVKPNSGKVENLYVQSDHQDKALSEGLDLSDSILVSSDKECTSTSESLVDFTEVVHEAPNTDSMKKNQQNDSPKGTILGHIEIEEELYDENQKTSEHIRSPDDKISGKACEDKLLNNEKCLTISETFVDSTEVAHKSSNTIENEQLYEPLNQHASLSKGSIESDHSNDTPNLYEQLNQHEEALGEGIVGFDLSVLNDQECRCIISKALIEPMRVVDDTANSRDTSNFVEQLNHHVALRKGSIEFDPLKSLSDLESQLILKVFELLEKEGPFQSEICDLLCIVEESKLSATSVFQIMLVLFLSQRSKWSACLSIHFIHLVKKVAHENLESSIDEGTSSEEIALIYFYFILNQLAKARASLEVNPIYAERFASLVKGYGPTGGEKNISVPESLLQQFAGRPSNINEEKIDSASMHLWKALHSSINSVLELKKKEGTDPPENESNPTQHFLEIYKCKVDGPLHVSQQGQANFTALVDQPQINIVDNKALTASNKTDLVSQSIESFNSIKTLVSNLAEYFSHDSTSTLQVASTANCPEEANKENKQATGKEILKIEFVSNENALQDWDFSPEAVEVVVNDFEPGFCPEEEIIGSKNIVYRSNAEPFLGFVENVGMKSAQSISNLDQLKTFEFALTTHISQESTLLNLKQSVSVERRDKTPEHEAKFRFLEKVDDSGQAENDFRERFECEDSLNEKLEVAENQNIGYFLTEGVPTQKLDEFKQCKDQDLVQNCKIDIDTSDIDLANESGESGQTENVLTVTSLLSSFVEHEMDKNEWSLQILPDNGLDPPIKCKSCTGLAVENRESRQTKNALIATLLSSSIEHDMDKNIESLEILAENMSTLELGEIEQTRNQETFQNCRGDIDTSVEYDDATTVKNDIFPPLEYGGSATNNNGLHPPTKCKSCTDLAVENRESGQTENALIVTLLSSCIEHDMDKNIEPLESLAENMSTLELGELKQTRNQETVQNCRGDIDLSLEYDDSTTEKNDLDPPVKCISGQAERVLIATSFSSSAEHGRDKNHGSLQILAVNIAFNTDAYPAEFYDVKHTENSGVDPQENKELGETKYILDVTSSRFADHDQRENDESLQILAEKIDVADSNTIEFREIKRVENVGVVSLVKCKANSDLPEESDVSGHSETVLTVSSISDHVKEDKEKNDESLPYLAKKVGICADSDPAENRKLEQSENAIVVISSSSFVKNDEVNGNLVSRNVSLAKNISGFENLKTLECALSTCFSEESYLLNLKQSLSTDSQDIIQEFEAKFGPMEEVDVSEQVEDFLRRRFEFSQAASELNNDHSYKLEVIEENMHVKSEQGEHQDLVNDLNDAKSVQEFDKIQHLKDQESFKNHVDCSEYTKEFNGAGQTEEALTQFAENDELEFTVKGGEPLHISGQTESVLFVKSLLSFAEKDAVKVTMISQNTTLAQSISGFDQLKTLECALSTCLSQDSITADIKDSASADSADIIQQYEVKFGPMEEVDDSKQVEDFLYRRINPAGISHVLYVAEGAKNEMMGKLIYLENQGSAYFCKAKVGANQQVDEDKKAEELGGYRNEDSSESCLHEKVIMSVDSRHVLEENKALQNNAFLDADESLQKNTKEMDRNDQDSQSSESSLDMISKYEAKFGPMRDVDESELALGFLNRFLALKAGGHFPDANVNAISLPEPVISVDEDDQSCVEVDLVHGYVKRELYNDIKVETLDIELSVKPILTEMRPDGGEDKEKQTTQFFVVQKALSNGTNDENSQTFRTKGKAEKWREKNEAFVKDFVATIKKAVSDARDEENAVGLGASPSEIRQGIDETPVVGNTMLPDIQIENSGFPLKHNMQPKESMMLPVYIESRREKTSCINRNESDTVDLSVVSSLSLFDFECQVKPQLSEPPCEIIVQEMEQSKIVHVKKDFAHSALSLFSKFAAMEEKFLKLEAHHAKVALQKHGVTMLGWKSPWNNHPTSHLRALSALSWAPNVGCINGIAAAAASLSRRRRAAGFQAPQKKSTLDRARAFDCSERIDVFSFQESINRSCHETKFDDLPWEKRNVRQRFLSEKSIETRNWFGSLVMTRGNDRYHQPVSHPSSVELDWETFPYPGSWEEIWFTPWQAFRANPNNLLIDQKFSNDSEDSEDLFDERPQIGVMVTVRQNVNESLTRVSYAHSSNLRRSRWRRKFYPYGTFPF